MTIEADLAQLANPARAAASQRFFKTGVGQYGEGDVFIGIAVPDLRRLIPKYQSLDLVEITPLLTSPIHEKRLLALFILVRQFQKGTPQTQETIYHFYVKNMRHVNNWDLVDSSAGHIIGKFLWEKPTTILTQWAASPHLWTRRIAIIATFYFIRKNAFQDTFTIAKLLLQDREDLIHKAVGWMLREIGNRDMAAEQAFLDQHHKTMPRTMLRYAIEKFPEEIRQGYLKGQIVDQSTAVLK